MTSSKPKRKNSSLAGGREEEKRAEQETGNTHFINKTVGQEVVKSAEILVINLVDGGSLVTLEKLLVNRVFFFLAASFLFFFDWQTSSLVPSDKMAGPFCRYHFSTLFTRRRNGVAGVRQRRQHRGSRATRRVQTKSIRLSSKQTRWSSDMS